MQRAYPLRKRVFSRDFAHKQAAGSYNVTISACMNGHIPSADLVWGRAYPKYICPVVRFDRRALLRWTPGAGITLDGVSKLRDQKMLWLGNGCAGRANAFASAAGRRGKRR